VAPSCRFPIRERWFTLRKVGARQDTSPVGQQLRAWRVARSRTQLQLATSVGSTARHLSFVETGRSRPGADLLRRLADELGLPDAALHALLASAGLPTGADADRHDAGHTTTVSDLLTAHEPFPACALDHHGAVGLANRSYLRLIPAALDLTPEQQVERFFGAPGREWIVNWSEIAWHEADRRLHDAQHRADPVALRLSLRALDLLADVPRPDKAQHGTPVTILRVSESSTVALRTIVLHPGGPPAAGGSELRVELTLPADDASRRWLTA
jgi:transcriptional regulator with XRE-family HTH domain